MLPTGPTLADLSPYNSPSAFAGNPLWIDLDLFVFHHFEPEANAQFKSIDNRQDRLEWTFEQVQDNPSCRASLQQFIKSHFWLEDYALFQAIKNAHNQSPWTEWPKELRDRDPNALAAFRKSHDNAIQLIIFEQYLFYHQWSALKQYARHRNIQLIGDMPIFVAHDSADVWANTSEFLLDDKGNPRVVAGVPPDYFSETGQRWGNPLYRWDAMQKNGYRWWKARLNHARNLFDLVRIDHFRGFEAYWEIPADETTAINGRWVKGPGMDFFNAVLDCENPVELIAEDLGVITPEVEALRDQLGLPGMKILQFAFDGTNSNPYLPHHHVPNSVVYTGTHDNNTSLGWFNELSETRQHHILNYYAWPQEAMPWPLIKSALASVAQLAIVPMQDLLALDSTHRMNTPGTVEGNWLWSFEWYQVNADLISYLAQLNSLYQRNAHNHNMQPTSKR